jgi:hypothetical protein
MSDRTIPLLVWLMTGFFASVYTQSVTPGTHVISDSESDNSGNEQKENINTGLEGTSYKSV